MSVWSSGSNIKAAAKRMVVEQDAGISSPL